MLNVQYPMLNAQIRNMSRFSSHVNTAKTIITQYKGEMPLSAFLKSFFAKEKKYGSRDRREISSVCYNYYRLGAAIKNHSIEEGLLISQFLLTNISGEWLQNEKPDWNERIGLPLSEKLVVAGIDAETIFPFNNELSNGIDVDHFNASFLIQPDLFIRIRPGKEAAVRQKLLAADVPFKEVNESCLAFTNGTKLEEMIDINREAVVQDYNSQKVGEVLTEATFTKPIKVWDCCAASGGKSIMTSDFLTYIQLTVSDVRESIIQNLKARFNEAGIKEYNSFVTDLTNAKSLQASLRNSRFDLIICDAPCSGSGTWSRTPEQLLFFKESEIRRYSYLQKSIVTNVIPHLQKGGYFLYITCSVFAKENEEVVAFIQSEFNLQLVKMKLLKGYDVKADSMFAALFTPNP